jgi:hypothetical protein
MGPAPREALPIFFSLQMQTDLTMVNIDLYNASAQGS